jgi:hypothetical protein
MKIIVNTFSYEVFFKYIPTPSEESLYNIIKKFNDMTKMQNIVKCIDNCHIPLYEKSKKKKIPTTWDCYNLNNLNYYCKLHEIPINYFEMYILCNLGECTNGKRLKLVNMYQILQNKLIL